jgi:hypothetical protein
MFFSNPDKAGYPHWMLEDFAERGREAHGDMNQLNQFSHVLTLNFLKNKIEKSWIQTLNNERDSQKNLLTRLPVLKSFDPTVTNLVERLNSQ